MVTDLDSKPFWSPFGSREAIRSPSGRRGNLVAIWSWHLRSPLINCNMYLMNTFQLHAFPVDYLNTIDVNSMPPHLLQLKKGVPIMLIRNLDSTRGHVNGTRYIIRELRKRVILAEIAVGPYKGKKLFQFLQVPNICLVLTQLLTIFRQHNPNSPDQVLARG